MKQRKILALLLALALLLTACGPAAGDGETSPTVPEPTDTPEPPSEPPEETEPAEEPVQTPGDIWLYGEQHYNQDIWDEELRLWKEAYDRGVRHMFIEFPYYTAEDLNRWMAAKNDFILKRTLNEIFWDFFIPIKTECPETVFHGTDVGHSYDIAGPRYLEYLRNMGLEDTEQYRLAQECIEQGRVFHTDDDWDYRETKMTENFIRELESLEGEEIMGFYGSAHVATAPFYNVTDTMASRLMEQYGERLHCLNLTYLAAPELEPERTDNILVGEGVYEASYFGKEDISSWSNYLCREFWRLEDAYEDFRDAPKTGNVLPYNNYPTRLEAGQVYVIDYTRKDGTVERRFFRSDGAVWQGMETTEEFLPPE